MKNPRFWLALHASALSLWFGALLTSALGAVFAFRSMKAMGPVATGFHAPPADHWQIVAGHMATPLFFAVDKLGAALALVSLLAMIGAFASRHALPPMPWRSRLHAAAYTATLCLFLAQVLFVSPRLSRSITEYWAAARADNPAALDAPKARFDALHPISSRLHGALAGTLLFTAMIALARIAPTHLPDANPSRSKTGT